MLVTLENEEIILQVDQIQKKSIQKFLSSNFNKNTFENEEIMWNVSSYVDGLVVRFVKRGTRLESASYRI